MAIWYTLLIFYTFKPMKQSKSARESRVSVELVCLGIALCIILGLAGLLFKDRPSSENSLVIHPPVAEAAIYNLPRPDSLIPTSRAHSYPVLKGIKIDPKDPFKLEFIIDTEDQEEVSQEEVNKLIKYFLAALTTPEEDLWVNLSPYEQDRIIADKLSFTDLGKDMLGQDYVLKQFLSSLTYPESELGRKYWSKIYEEVYQLASTTNIPINTFNKVWIVPKKAQIYENGNLAVIAYADLKAMYEEDYLALKEGAKSQITDQTEKINKVASDVMKGIILPEIERDVNYGENFAKLRQMYHSFILASWFKQKLKDTVFQYYIDQSKTEGIDLKDKDAKEKIYNLYVEAYKKGVYNYIRDDYDQNEGKQITRQYYSGGLGLQWTDDNFSSSPASEDEMHKFVDEQDDTKVELRVNPVSPEQPEPSDLNLAMASSSNTQNEYRGLSDKVESLLKELLLSGDENYHLRAKNGDQIATIIQAKATQTIDEQKPLKEKIAESKKVVRLILSPVLKKLATTPREAIEGLDRRKNKKGAWVVKLPMRLDELIKILDRREENDLELLAGETKGEIAKYLYVERGGMEVDDPTLEINVTPDHLRGIAEVIGHSHPKHSDVEPGSTDETDDAVTGIWTRPEIILHYDGEHISLALRLTQYENFEIYSGRVAIKKLVEFGYLSSEALSSSPLNIDTPENTGGINFDPANLNLNVEGDIFFSFPLETIRKFQTSTGLTFQILRIEKGVDLDDLLGGEKELSHRL